VTIKGHFTCFKPALCLACRTVLEQSEVTFVLYSPLFQYFCNITHDWSWIDTRITKHDLLLMQAMMVEWL